MKVLVVDDNEEITEAVSFFEKQGIYGSSPQK